MPRITWNAQVRSVRRLRDLQTIKLLNYKQVMQGPNSDTALIRMQLEFHPSHSIPNPYKPQIDGPVHLEVKTYLVNKEGL